MPRLTKQERDNIRKDKGKMSILQLTEKYGVSKATVHRVLQGSSKTTFEDTASVNVPVTSMMGDDFGREFTEVLTGQSEAPPVKEEHEHPVDRHATSKLAEHLFADLEEEHEAPQMEDIVKVEDPVERNAVIQRIMLNLDNFAPVFTFIHNKEEFVRSLHSKSLDDLRGILKTMETTRTTVNLSNQMKQTFMMVAKGTEVLGNRFLNLKTGGFTEQLLAQKQELDMIFRELAIDYAPKFTFQTRPEIRLAMLYGMTLLQTDNSNRIREFIESRATAEVPETQEQKFGDL